jgi:hypothetical protein
MLATKMISRDRNGLCPVVGPSHNDEDQTPALDRRVSSFTEFNTMGSIQPAPKPKHPEVATDICLDCVRGTHTQTPNSPLFTCDPIAASLGLWAELRELDYQAKLADIKSRRRAV